MAFAIRVTTPTQPNIDMPGLLRFTASLNDLTDELGQIFPERTHLIKRIVYALLTRENVLTFGPFGTGKTDLLTTLFEAFQGATVFSIGLSKFMTEGHIFGIPDPKKMRDEGEIFYRIEGSILDAHFAELDEIFDANGPLLRALLGILNERHFKRGRQNQRIKLHTGLASTNGLPEEEVKKDRSLGAVIDRFLFQSEVSYLTEPGNRLRMYDKYVKGEKPSATLNYDDLLAVSATVVDANQFIDPFLLEVHDQIVQALQIALKRQISDRRACKLLKIAEAEALLRGRYAVQLEDLRAIEYGICIGGRPTEVTLFQDAVGPILDKAVQQREENSDAAIIKRIGDAIAQAPVLLDITADADLVPMRRALDAVRRELNEMRPQLTSTREMARKGVEAMDERIRDVDTRIKGEVK